MFENSPNQGMKYGNEKKQLSCWWKEIWLTTWKILNRGINYPSTLSTCWPDLTKTMNVTWLLSTCAVVQKQRIMKNASIGCEMAKHGQTANPTNPRFNPNKTHQLEKSRYGKKSSVDSEWSAVTCHKVMYLNQNIALHKMSWWFCKMSRVETFFRTKFMIYPTGNNLGFRLALGMLALPLLSKWTNSTGTRYQPIPMQSGSVIRHGP